MAEMTWRTEEPDSKFPMQHRHHGVGRCVAWKTCRWPAPVTPGSRCACGLNRSALPTLLTCCLCMTTTRCGLGTANEKPSVEQAEQWAKFMGDSWRFHGVHKWIAYDRVSDEVVGRGGLSRTPVDDDWGQIHAFLPAEPWVRVAHEIRRPLVAHANWLEIGWALRREFWGRGYASEIGRAGLAFAFDVLGVQAVVSCTVGHTFVRVP
jgi:RimJ/RimL family protein N-acetyltransferase